MNSSGRLVGKRCVVTGGSRGFGREIALAFAREGASVCVNYLSAQEKAESVVKEVRSLGPEAVAVQADVSRLGDVQRLFAETDGALGGVDVLVNNAGFNKSAPLLDIEEGDLDRVMDVNFKGAFFCTQEAGRRMMEQGHGVIVNMASMAGLRSRAASAHYGAAKAAVVSLTKSSAEAFAPHVRVNCIAPGFFDTELNAYVPREKREEISRLVPMGRWGDPREVADLALFLATAPTYVTGNVVEIAGGMQNNYVK